AFLMRGSAQHGSRIDQGCDERNGLVTRMYEQAVPNAGQVVRARRSVPGHGWPLRAIIAGPALLKPGAGQRTAALRGSGRSAASAGRNALRSESARSSIAVWPTSFRT